MRACFGDNWLCPPSSNPSHPLDTLQWINPKSLRSGFAAGK
jgi:hypothetical protein